MEAARRITLYALSTCGWCKKTKALLGALGVDYKGVDIDLLAGEERENAMAKLSEANPLRTLPTLTSAAGDCIIGFQEEKIRALFHD